MGERAREFAEDTDAREVGEFLALVGGLSFRQSAAGDVEDGGEDKLPLWGGDRAEPDFDGDGGSVLMPSGFFHHGSRMGFLSADGRGRSCCGRGEGEAAGNELLERGIEQLSAGVAEDGFHLGIDEADVSVVVDHGHGVGSGLDDAAKAVFRFFLFGDVH